MDMHPSLNSELIIHQANFVAVSSEWSKRVFPYPHHRIYYVTGGQADLLLKDRQVSLDPGNMYLLPAFSMVEAVCRHSLVHYYVHFQAVSGYRQSLFDMHRPSLSVRVEKPDQIQSLFDTIISNSHETLDGQLLALGSLHLLLAPFFKGAAPPSRTANRFANVLSYIEQNIHRKMNVTMLANLMELDPVYFSNLFSATFGLPPNPYITMKRMEKAQLLLLQTRKKIKEIAYDVGFDNEMYFSRVFHAKTGKTPGEYRRLLTSVNS